VKRNIYVARHIPAAFFPNDTGAKALKLSPYLASREILVHETLEDVVRGCDTYIEYNIFRDKSTTVYVFDPSQITI